MLERAFNFRSESFISIILDFICFWSTFKIVQYPHFHPVLAAFPACGRLTICAKQNQNTVWQSHNEKFLKHVCLGQRHQDHREETLYRTFCRKQIQLDMVDINTTG